MRDSAAGPDAAHAADTAEAPEATTPATQKRTVLVAPVALGPLAGHEAAARQVFADELSDRLNLFLNDVAATAPNALPDADAKDWGAGPVPAASDASLVVLTRVIESVLQPDGSVEAVVEMRAFDPSDASTPIFMKKAHGHGAAGATGNLATLEENPEVAASWDACTTLVGALVKVLQAKPDEAEASTPAPAPGSTVSVEIDSDPPGADIDVDGKFAGNTPTHLDLPRHSLTMHLELKGQVWERTLTPVDGMRIQPLLGKPASAPAAASPGAPDQATGKDPQPVRAQVDPTLPPPTPDQLVVPDGK